jgi:hypothetical protein
VKTILFGLFYACHLRVEGNNLVLSSTELTGFFFSQGFDIVCDNFYYHCVISIFSVSGALSWGAKELEPEAGHSSPFSSSSVMCGAIPPLSYRLN